MALTHLDNIMYTAEEKNYLLKQVKSSIEYGLNNHYRNTITETPYPETLNEKRACFVTLHLNNNLRGCIGSLTTTHSLIEDVNSNAYSAAFEDPRFPKLTQVEYSNIDIEISVLSLPERMIFTNEEDLLSQLRIGIDGLVFECRHYRSTYLPSVWEMLPTPKEFLCSLKEKAGLSSDFWSDDVHCSRYTTEMIK